MIVKIVAVFGSCLPQLGKRRLSEMSLLTPALWMSGWAILREVSILGAAARTGARNNVLRERARAVAKGRAAFQRLLVAMSLVAPMAACSHSPTGPEARPQVQAVVTPPTLPGGGYSRAFYPRQAVNGACGYPRAYRAGENIAAYVREMTRALREAQPPDLTRVPEVDLDCFAALSPGTLTDRPSDDDPISLYVVYSLRWLAADETFRTVDTENAARLLRLDRALELRFGDAFLLIARRVRDRACAILLAETAISFGTFDAILYREHLVNAGGDASDYGCVKNLGEAAPEPHRNEEMRTPVSIQPLPVISHGLPGTDYSRWFFPPESVDGRCRYPRPLREGESLAEYLEIAIP